MDINIALDTFIANYTAAHQAAKLKLQIEYDPDWPSPCCQSQSENLGWVEWAPIIREHPGNFSDLEQALDIQMNSQLKAFFGRYWSDNLDAQTSRGKLQLLQAWNQADFERLQQNLIGHVLMKRRLKQPETWFFAVTDEDDFILSVDNASGNVVLEQVGLMPKEVLADDLCSFLQTLTPIVND